MACPQPAAGVPIEVLVEEDVVTPKRVVRVACEGAVAWPRPALLRYEQRAEPLRQFVRHTFEICQPARSRWAFNPEVITLVAVVLAEGLNQQEVDGEPNWPTPVRVPTHLLRVHVARYVFDRVFVRVAVRAKHIRPILIHARQR